MLTSPAQPGNKYKYETNRDLTAEKLEVLSFGFDSVLPGQLVTLLGGWGVVMYTVLALHWLPVLLAGLVWLVRRRAAPLTLLALISLPPATASLAALGVLVPSAGEPRPLSPPSPAARSLRGAGPGDGGCAGPGPVHGGQHGAVRWCGRPHPAGGRGRSEAEHGCTAPAVPTSRPSPRRYRAKAGRLARKVTPVYT